MKQWIFAVVDNFLGTGLLLSLTLPLVSYLLDFGFLFFTIPYAAAQHPKSNNTNNTMENQRVLVPNKKPNNPSKYMLPTIAPHGFKAEQITSVQIPIKDIPIRTIP